MKRNQQGGMKAVGSGGQNSMQVDPGPTAQTPGGDNEQFCLATSLSDEQEPCHLEACDKAKLRLLRRRVGAARSTSSVYSLSTGATPSVGKEVQVCGPETPSSLSNATCLTQISREAPNASTPSATRNSYQGPAPLSPPTDSAQRAIRQSVSRFSNASTSHCAAHSSWSQRSSANCDSRSDVEARSDLQTGKKDEGNLSNSRIRRKDEVIRRSGVPVTNMMRPLAERVGVLSRDDVPAWPREAHCAALRSSTQHPNVLDRSTASPGSLCGEKFLAHHEANSPCEVRATDRPLFPWKLSCHEDISDVVVPSNVEGQRSERTDGSAEASTTIRSIDGEGCYRRQTAPTTSLGGGEVASLGTSTKAKEWSSPPSSPPSSPGAPDESSSIGSGGQGCENTGHPASVVGGMARADRHFASGFRTRGDDKSRGLAARHEKPSFSEPCDAAELLPCWTPSTTSSARPVPRHLSVWERTSGRSAVGKPSEDVVEETHVSRTDCSKQIFTASGTSRETGMVYSASQSTGSLPHRSRETPQPASRSTSSLETPPVVPGHNRRIGRTCTTGMSSRPYVTRGGSTNSSTASLEETPSLSEGLPGDSRVAPTAERRQHFSSQSSLIVPSSSHYTSEAALQRRSVFQTSSAQYTATRDLEDFPHQISSNVLQDEVWPAVSAAATRADWNQQATALTTLRVLAKFHPDIVFALGSQKGGSTPASRSGGGTSTQPSIFSLRALAGHVARLIDSPRSAVAKHACLCLADLFHFGGKKMDCTIDEVLETVLRKSCQASDFLNEAAFSVLIAICSSASEQRVASSILHAVDGAKQKASKATAIRCLAILLDRVGPAATRLRDFNSIIRLVTQTSAEASADLRMASRACLAILKQNGVIFHSLRGFSQTEKNKMDEVCDKTTKQEVDRILGAAIQTAEPS